MLEYVACWVVCYDSSFFSAYGKTMERILLCIQIHCHRCNGPMKMYYPHGIPLYPWISVAHGCHATDTTAHWPNKPLISTFKTLSRLARSLSNSSRILFHFRFSHESQRTLIGQSRSLSQDVLVLTWLKFARYGWCGPITRCTKHQSWRVCRARSHLLYLRFFSALA